MRLGACSIWSSLSLWSQFPWNLYEMSLNPYFLNVTKKHFWCVSRFLLQFDIKFFSINLTFINWETWTSMPRFIMKAYSWTSYIHMKLSRIFFAVHSRKVLWMAIFCKFYLYVQYALVRCSQYPEIRNEKNYRPKVNY